MGIATAPSSTYQRLKGGKSLLEILRGSTISKMGFALVVIIGKLAKLRWRAGLIQVLDLMILVEHAWQLCEDLQLYTFIQL